MPSPTTPSHPLQQNVDLDVCGAIPSGLSGRLLGIGRDGVVHTVHVDAGRVSYRVRQLRTDAVIHNLVTFGISIFAIAEDSSAYELNTEIDTLRRVDLAGHGRALAANPKRDAATGELHLIAHDTDGVQAHVVVSAGALTRRTRPILGATGRIKDVAISRDHTVFICDGFVGIAPRDGEVRTTWIATDAAAPHPVQAHDAGDAVTLLALTPSVERWTLRPGTRTIEREVLDKAPRRFAHLIADVVEGAPRWLWTTGEQTVARHDLVDSHHAHQSLRPNEPGDFVVVPDVARPDNTAGGWLVGIVHDEAGTTDFCVTDAADIASPSVATARVPRPIPHDLPFTWIPSIQH